MQVFLTGATGYIGTAVADRLHAAGHELTSLARSDSAAAPLTAAGIRPVRGDFSDPTSAGAATRAADAVISMATTYDAAVDGPAVDAILDALAGSDKPFIYTSGIWSHGDTGGTVVDETSLPRPAALIAWRQAVEDRVRDVAEAASRGAGAGGRTVSWPLSEARQTLGAYADALVLDQQASGRHAEETLGWRPHRTGVLEDIERGFYAGGAR